jgi:hypothetical protein
MSLENIMVALTQLSIALGSGVGPKPGMHRVSGDFYFQSSIPTEISLIIGMERSQIIVRIVKLGILNLG